MSDYKIPAKDRFKNRYSYAYKMEVVKSIENGKLSQNQASKYYGVHRKTISGWLKKYANFDKKLREMGEKSPKENIADLRAKLRVSEGENEVLKAVMNIIEDEYGEEVLKKYLPESLIKTLPNHRKKVNISILCKLFGISRQAYYQGVARSRKALDQRKQIVNKAKNIRRYHKRMGGIKLYKKLSTKFQESGIKCGRDKFLDILRTENLMVPYRKRFIRTTDSNHKFRKYPNLILKLAITRAEQVWVSDITYIKTKQGFMYLFLITDAYSKQIMGWDLSDNLRTVNAIKALRMAINNRKYPTRPLIHHSDRGIQYCTPSYIEVLQEHNINISMTTKYDPYENAVAERVNGILKTEYEIGEGFLSAKDARREINFAIWLYNTDRPHMSCNMMVPAEAHLEENFELKKWSKSFSSSKAQKEKNNVVSLTINNNLESVNLF